MKVLRVDNRVTGHDRPGSGVQVTSSHQQTVTTRGQLSNFQSLARDEERKRAGTHHHPHPAPPGGSWRIILGFVFIQNILCLSRIFLVKCRISDNDSQCCSRHTAACCRCCCLLLSLKTQNNGAYIWSTAAIPALVIITDLLTCVINQIHKFAA